MHLHTRNRVIGLLLFATAVVTAAASNGQEAAKPSAEETAIRQRGSEYVAAVRRGDAAEIASFWTADGDYVDELGTAVKGRVLARRAKGPADERLAQRLTVTADSIRLVTPDVAVEDGGIISTAGALSGSIARRYTAIWVRQKGKWLLDGVREMTVPAVTGFEHLKQLDWMVGDWISDDNGKTVRLACKWSSDRNFLLREIDVRFPEREPLHVTQRIGWDAREKQIKSWTFDSEGGHGNSLWFRKADQWIIEAESVLASGSHATGTHLLAPDGDDAFWWESTNGEVDGEAVPGQKVRMIRTTSIP